MGKKITYCDIALSLVYVIWVSILFLTIVQSKPNKTLHIRQVLAATMHKNTCDCSFLDTR